MYEPAQSPPKRYVPSAAVVAVASVLPPDVLNVTIAFARPGSPASWSPLRFRSVQTRSPRAPAHGGGVLSMYPKFTLKRFSPAARPTAIGLGVSSARPAAVAGAVSEYEPAARPVKL